ncbi:hypothetical protein MMPV_006842 [Pyropia vietnamensis]
MIFPAWLPVLGSALWNPITCVTSVVLVLTELGSGRPVQIPRISDASVASRSARVAFIVLGAFSAAFLFAAALTTYTTLLVVPRLMRRRWRMENHARGGTSASGAAPAVPLAPDSPSAPVSPPVPRWVARTGLLCAAIASVALVVSSGTDVFSGAHDNATQLYVVAELVWLLVVITALYRGRSRTGWGVLAAAMVALLAIIAAIVMLITSLILIRVETDGANVITPATLAAGERVPASLNSYFNIFSLGEYIFLLSLSAFNVCLAWASRHDRAYFGPPAAPLGGGYLSAGISTPSSSRSSDEVAVGKKPLPAAAVTSPV